MQSRWDAIDGGVADRLTEVGKTIGIDVLDHIVMGRKAPSVYGRLGNSLFG